MKKAFLLLLLFCSWSLVMPQSSDENPSESKPVIILMNPTAGNLEVVNFLVKNKLLAVDTEKISFTGVYHKAQNYDFSKSEEYIVEHHLSGYSLYEVTGDICEKTVFTANGCSGEFGNLFRNSIGVIFFGGADIPPAVYDEENLFSSTNDTTRHFFEVSFLFHLIGGSKDPGYRPLLEDNESYMVTGFCLGMQSMNVAAGGSLFQDIPAQIYSCTTDDCTLKISKTDLHRNYWQNLSNDPDLMGINLHPLQFTGNRFFTSKVGTPDSDGVVIYSSHHQSVKKLGEGLDITALSYDGKVIEGLAHKKYPNVFAVQFHPEVPALYEHRSKVKFSPEDQPATLHELAGKESLKFHRKYWAYISGIIKANSRNHR